MATVAPARPRTATVTMVGAAMGAGAGPGAGSSTTTLTALPPARPGTGGSITTTVGRSASAATTASARERKIQRAQEASQRRLEEMRRQQQRQSKEQSRQRQSREQTREQSQPQQIQQRQSQPPNGAARHAIKRSKGSVEEMRRMVATRTDGDGSGDVHGHGLGLGSQASTGNAGGRRAELRPFARNRATSGITQTGASPGDVPGVAVLPPTAQSNVVRPWPAAQAAATQADGLLAPQRHGRSHSFSTVDDNPKTAAAATAATTTAVSILRVPIPHYRIGKPNWTGRGSALLSSGLNSETASQARSETSSRPSSVLLVQQPTASPHRPRMSRSAGPASPQLRSRAISHGDYKHGAVVMPEVVLVALEAPGPRGSQALVRIVQRTGQVLAATPSGLVAHITSPNLLDYDLLSDFFLTFRSYLSTLQLLDALFGRLVWAVDRADDFGRIVRVRVFVALRHWILNYFPDDFVPDLSLRVKFCNLTNALAEELSARDDGSGDMKVIGELKKCWRRTCGLYWDISAHAAEGALDRILAGGVMGSRSPSPHGSGSVATMGPGLRTKASAELNRTPAVDSAAAAAARARREQNSPGAGSPRQTHTHTQTQTQPQPQPQPPNRDSDVSMLAMSCSIPKQTRTRSKSAGPKTGSKGAASPPAPVRTSPGPPTLERVASTSLPPSVARNRSRVRHNRKSSSFSDTWRDTPGPAPVSVDATKEHPSQLAGNLVRGAWVLPGPPDVLRRAPPTPVDERQSFTLNYPSNTDGHGMKRLLGSMRRALAKHDGEPRRSDEADAPPFALQAPPPKSTAVRVDVLIIKAAQSFDKATQGAQIGVAITSAPSYSTLRPDSGDDAIKTIEAPEFTQTGTGTVKHEPSASLQRNFAFPRPPDASTPRTEHGDRQLRPPMEIELSETPSILSSTNATEESSVAAAIRADLGPTGGDPSAAWKASAPDAGDDEADTTTSDPFHLDRIPQLRRKPGGDLRGATHVHSLDARVQSATSSESSAYLLAPPLPLAQQQLQPDPEAQPVLSEAVDPDLSAEAANALRVKAPPLLELEVARLAQLPDPEEDGGIEATLRKLEGNYSHGGESITDTVHGRGQHEDREDLDDLHGDNDSDTSTPLVARGASHPAQRRRRSSTDWLQVSLPKIPHPPAKSSLSKMENADNLELHNVSRDPAVPQSSGTTKSHRSFLLSENQSLTDLKRRGHTRQPTEETFLIDDGVSLLSGIAGQALDAPIEMHRLDAARQVDVPKVQDEPAHVAPQHSHLPFILEYPSLLLAQQLALIEKDALAEIDWRELIEIRWKQSSDARPTWADILQPAGVEAGRIPGGVDVCISRFNLMVKWVSSEIVLCDDIDDRAACIIKYIHIALHARKMQNWATMYQLTMSLVSSDIARLKQTWARVPEKERNNLAALETLIMPTRNFANLRNEVEVAAMNVDIGCIPFIGLYTHDLIYNSQKPAHAAVPAGVEIDEPFINFERHRTAAAIVKDLLHLMDASARYDFEPVPEVLSRCLWMARLDDAEISARSNAAEP